MYVGILVVWSLFAIVNKDIRYWFNEVGGVMSDPFIENRVAQGILTTSEIERRNNGCQILTIPTVINRNLLSLTNGHWVHGSKRTRCGIDGRSVMSSPDVPNPVTWCIVPTKQSSTSTSYLFIHCTGQIGNLQRFRSSSRMPLLAYSLFRRALAGLSSKRRIGPASVLTL